MSDYQGPDRREECANHALLMQRIGRGDALFEGIADTLTEIKDSINGWIKDHAQAHKDEKAERDKRDSEIEKQVRGLRDEIRDMKTTWATITAIAMIALTLFGPEIRTLFHLKP